MTVENTEVKTITITLEYFHALIDDSNQLAHLEANGVDNWGGYSRYESEEENEDLDEADQEFLRCDKD